MSSQKVFVQFQYCPLCRINHKKGKKHVFAKRHKDIVTNVLAKFIKKIVFAKSTMKKPPIHENSWDEANKTFWCYFCQNEIEKHRKHFTATGDCIVEQGGMLEHLTRGDHVESTVKFLRENKIDLSRTSYYKLSTDDYLKYLEVVDNACSQYFKEKTDALKLLAKDLKNQELNRSHVFSSGLLDQSLNQQQRKPPHFSHAASHSSQNYLRSGNADEQGRKTIQAFGEGLTAIERSNEDDSLGNIYTNALPPWLMVDDEEPDSSGLIGPTLEDLEKHRKLEKKRQLPSCRVGAKFDHKTDTAEAWLPNFGGVWCHGRRTNSAQQFNRRKGRMVSSPKQNTMSGPRGSQESLQADIQTNKQSFIPLHHPTDLTQLATSSVVDSLVTHGSRADQTDQFVPGRDNFFTFTQHTASTCGGVQMLGQSDISQSDFSSIIVKPYVRKCKQPNTEGPPHPSNDFRPDQSFERWGDPLRPNHHISPSIMTHGLSFGLNCNTFETYQTNTSDTSKSISNVHSTGTLRLISTPVLDKKKK